MNFITKSNIISVTLFLIVLLNPSIGHLEQEKEAFSTALFTGRNLKNIEMK